MSQLKILAHEGKKIICLDFSNFKLTKKDEINSSIEDAKAEIRKNPPKSVLLITNVSGTGFDNDLTATFKEYANHNTPYIKASAIVGLSGLQKIIFTAIKTVTKREYYIANTMDEAMDWLVKQ